MLDSWLTLKAQESFTSVHPRDPDLSAGPLVPERALILFWGVPPEGRHLNINRGRVIEWRKLTLLSGQTQNMFYHDCSWSITTAVAIIAVIIAFMKRHHREAAGNAMNDGKLKCKRVERGEGANKPDWPVDCCSSLKIHQSCNGADLMAHLQVKIAQRTASIIIFMCKQAGTNSRCQGTFPPLSNCSFILLST